jgi:hypothetical protein
MLLAGMKAFVARSVPRDALSLRRERSKKRHPKVPFMPRLGKRDQ